MLEESLNKAAGGLVWPVASLKVDRALVLPAHPFSCLRVVFGNCV
jgi:hypothetical protein